MSNDAFVLGFGLGFALIFRWAFRALPQERWQILASVPRAKEDAAWRGMNLTYYGLLFASAVALGTATFVALLSAAGVPLAGTMLVSAAVLGSCAPAARLVARLVEGKTGTFTIGGASFVGIILAVPLIWMVNEGPGAYLGVEVPVGVALSALFIGYALGEGTGRLACISFGCCYGRALADSHPLYRRLFGRWHFVFVGPSKKAAYEGGLEREPVIPIQAITAVIYVAAGLVGVGLFLRGAFQAAVVEVALVTLLWRVASETLRADYRGAGRVSLYQVMAATGALYAPVAVWLVPPRGPIYPDAVVGLAALWNPGVILFLELVWAAIFVYSGRSVVTASTISIHVVTDRI